MQQFEGSMVTSTQIPTNDILNMFDEEGKPLMSDTTRAAMGKLDMTNEDSINQTGERIKKLENEVTLKLSEISELKNQMQLKVDIIQLNDGKINSLEMDS